MRKSLPLATKDGRVELERTRFDRRVRALKDTLWRVAMSLAGEADVADEVVQLTLIRMWERRDSYTGTGSYRAWAVAIMRNIWKDEWRRARRQAHVPLEACLNLPDPRADVEAECRAKHRSDVLRAALSRLGAREREALLAHHVEGLPLSEVARMQGMSRKTADELVRRACRRLRSMDDVLKLTLD